jgi:hypothetical protein
VPRDTSTSMLAVPRRRAFGWVVREGGREGAAGLGAGSRSAGHAQVETPPALVTSQAMSCKVNLFVQSGRSVCAVVVPSAFNVSSGFGYGGGAAAPGTNSVTGNNSVSYLVSLWVNVFARLGSLTVSWLRCGLFNPLLSYVVNPLPSSTSTSP